MMPAPRSERIGTEVGPNGNGCPTEMIPSSRTMNEEEDCVEEDLDDETAHVSPLVDVAAG